MASEKTPTSSLQKQIEKIDSDILKLLIKRVELTKSLQAKMRLSKDLISYMPDKEAIALRNVIKQNNGRLTIPTLAKIWREILAGESQFYRPYSIAVYTKERAHEMMEMSKDYFGTSAKYIPCLSISQAIQKLDTKEAGVAILPLFEQSEESWWTSLGTGEHKNVKILAKLPFLKNADQLAGREAFVIGTVDHKETGNDRSLFAVEMATQTSIASLKSLMEDVGLTVHQVWPAYNLSRIYLFAVEVEGLVTMNDKRIAAFQEKQEKNLQVLRSIGGYAVQEVLE